jgi:hypothetical protein
MLQGKTNERALKQRSKKMCMKRTTGLSKKFRERKNHVGSSVGWMFVLLQYISNDSNDWNSMWFWWIFGNQAAKSKLVIERV